MIVDTGVLIEYINGAGTYHEKVKKLIESYTPLYVTPITLSEVLYVSYRVYITAGLSNANNYAKEFVEWLSAKLKFTEINHEIVIKAGEIKKKYGIACQTVM
jgi:PIN domain.